MSRIAVRLASFVMLLLLVSIPHSAQAFKVDVHIWIAQQVLNDARDGKISVRVGSSVKEIELSSRVSSALRRHPKFFLLGSLGPDAFPDVFSGQMIIHPSVRGGWGTSEWMQHLFFDNTLNDEELAFVLGYLTHGSADVFAHTFVNRYAGDLFELQDHEWVAIRHLNIEGYVSNFLPDLFDKATNRSSNAHAALNPSTVLKIPELLLLRRLLLNGDAMAHMKKSGNAPHLVAAYDLHRELTDFTAKDGLLLDIEALALKLVIEATAGIPIAQEQAKKLQELSNKVNAELNNVAGDIAKFAQDVNTRLGEIEGLRNEIVAGAMGETVKFADRYLEVQFEIARKTADAAELVKKIQMAPMTKIFDICGSIPIIGKVCNAAERLNPDRIIFEVALRATREAIERLDQERQALRPKIEQAIKEGLDVVQKVLDTRIAITNQFIAFVGEKPFGNEFRRRMEVWRDNIPVVLAEFSRANAQAILNTINPAKPDITKPLKQWLICYGPGLTSIPVKATSGICIVWNGVDDIKKEFDEFERKLAELSPITEAIVSAKQKLEKELKKLKDAVFSEAIMAGLREFDKRANSNSTFIYKALEKPVGPDDLNEVMSLDRDNQGLLLIPDTAQRILAEMNLKNGRFDPEKFTPARNAVVLSKLAMLDKVGLQKLARLGGVGNSVFGPQLFSDDTPHSQNILFGFIQNIDGNHQWHDLSPPHPRQNGFDAEDFDQRTSDKDFRYGYADEGCSRALGMRLWADNGAREKLFKTLFKGKLAPGVDDPKNLGGGFEAVLPANYPDLFNGNEWEDDGLTLVPKPQPLTKVLTLTDQEPLAREANVFLDNQLIDTVAYSDAGALNHTVSLNLTQLNQDLKVGTTGTEGRLISVTRRKIDCAGALHVTSGVLTSMKEVMRGDNLWKISKELVGEGRRYVELFQANTAIVRDADLIYPGQSLSVPWKSSLQVAIN
ncbi:MAG: zinc dependent phospholipase C family protein [Hyphomicrobiales bacterium]|nr:zinc dependent phospholipase C family protein [Hyphomicrobiales bacterium]